MANGDVLIRGGAAVCSDPCRRYSLASQADLA